MKDTELKHSINSTVCIVLTGLSRSDHGEIYILLFFLPLLLLLSLTYISVADRQLQKRERTGKEYGCFPFV